jgi:hypothetical protein
MGSTKRKVVFAGTAFVSVESDQAKVSCYASRIIAMSWEEIAKDLGVDMATAVRWADEGSRLPPFSTHSTGWPRCIAIGIRPRSVGRAWRRCGRCARRSTRRASGAGRCEGDYSVYKQSKRSLAVRRRETPSIPVTYFSQLILQFYYNGAPCASSVIAKSSVSH